MNVHPMRPAATPKGSAPANTEGADPTAGGEFASLVAAMLGSVVTDPTLTAMPGAPTTAVAVVGDGTTPSAANVDLSALTAAPADADAVADLVAEAMSAATVTATAEAAAGTTVPIADPAPSAAVVLQARQPAAAEDTPAPTTAEGTIAGTGVDAAEAAPVAMAAARPANESDESDTSSIDLSAVDAGARRPTGVDQTAATGRAREAAPAAPAAPAQQIAAVISPLRQRGDGSYRLSLYLKPEHLGNVRLEVELHNGTIDLQVHTEHRLAKDLLTDNLDDLRRELERSGLRAGSFDVGTNDERQQQAMDQAQQQSGRSSFGSLFGPDRDAEPVAPTLTIPVTAPAGITDDAVDVLA